MNGPRILLVEDDPDNRRLLQTMLLKLGCAVDAVADGESALAALGGASYACVLMDVQLPGIDGLEATRRLRESGLTGLPVIAVTAHAMQGDRERCLKAGMNAYLTKPLTLEMLGKALREVGVG